MRCLTPLSTVSLLTARVFTQQVNPSAPPKVVSQHAQNVLSSEKTSACEAACAQIALKLPTDRFHLKPNEINYIWSAQQGELTPACRAVPTSAEEVSTILSIVKENQCHFAVKSGGHSQHAGASTADGGVTIDLAKMNKVEVSPDRKSVYVGAGAQWVDVYRTVEAEDLLVVGGRVADVGVGGLLTGGGISLLSSKYGWGCDNILSFEVVLPDGMITPVDQQHHPELYRALRGAGFSNFGIVTSFTLEAIVPANPQGFWTEISVFDTSKVPTLLDEHYQIITSKVAEDQDAAYLHTLVYDPRHDAKLVYIMHFHASHSDPSTYPDIFSYTSNIEPIMPPDIKIRPYSNITKMLYDTNPLPGKRNLYVSFHYKPSRQLDEKLTTLFFDTVVPKVQNISGIACAMVMQPTFVNQQRTKRGGNALNIAAAADEDAKAINLVLLPWTWDHAEDDELIEATLRSILEQAETWAKELGVYHPFIYANYAGPWQDIWGGYGQENVEGLKKLQRKYDPEEIFTTGGLASGGFKLNVKGAMLGEGGEESKIGRKDEL